MNLDLAFQRVRQLLLEQQGESGHWIGQLSASALSTATTISAFSFYLETELPTNEERTELQLKIDAGIRWIMNRQNDDGGWGDTDKSKSNISTTLLVEAALTAAGRADEFGQPLDRARSYIQEQGGIPGLRARYGVDKTFAVPILANCAMAGLVPWKQVAALPFEAACVPQRFYHWLQLPVVSYAIPALVAIGQVKFANDPPWNPLLRLIRQLSVGRSLNVLQRMQPSTGGFLEAAPLTGFVSMGLIKSGQARHPVVQNGLRFLRESFRPEPRQANEASVPIDTNLATWVTTLSINALANAPHYFDCQPESWQATLGWVLSCQNKNVHPFTGAKPGGWGWSDLSGAVPDADDTPGAILALRNLHDLVDFDDSTKRRIRDAVQQGIRWLIDLQNRDDGWPTFCRGWGKLPFDRSGLDITAHVLRAFVAWQTHFDSAKLQNAVNRGFLYLDQGQREDGSWLPLWFGNQDNRDDENPVYGTAKVLAAYRDADRFNTHAAKLGLKWLRENQNSDGGWGGGLSLDWQVGRLGQSSVEETALAVEVLLDDPHPESTQATAAGIEWLVSAVESNRISGSSPIGFYFAKLWYYEQLYPLIFATAALARAIAKCGQATDRSSPAAVENQR